MVRRSVFSEEANVSRPVSTNRYKCWWFGLAAGLYFWVGAFTQDVSAQQDLADVIERCEKSVVRIEVNGKRGGGLGSGFVVSDDGMMVTNVHVLAGASEATATFPNGDTYRIIGTYSVDQSRDICIAQIEATGLTAIPLAAGLPRKGENVAALGSPQGLSFTATRGIISAVRSGDELSGDTGRSLKGTWVQVDAALSPGNSGGPLINSAGEVVAMSTLASQGRAQNLNFGISVDDIKAAIAAAKNTQVVAFSDAVGKIDMEDARPESAELIDRKPIPASALEEYVARGRDNYADLEKKLRKDLYDAEKKLGEMKRGTADGRVPEGKFAIRDTGRGNKYYFSSPSAKEEVVAEQQAIVDDLKAAKDGVKSTIDDESLFKILWHYGPKLDPRKENGIGFLTKGIVLHPFNAHDVAIDYNDAPCLLWVKSTAGLAAGQMVKSGPVFVAGTETLRLPGAGSMAVTVLHAVTETELRNAIFGDDSSAASGEAFRVWTDVTGKFKVEATVVEKDATNVVLRKRNGEIVTVPLSKLSDGDLKFLPK